MTVVRTRRTRSARTLLALACGFTALLGGCSSKSRTAPGTPVITLSDSGGDFASYRVVIGSITLTNTNGTVVSPLLTPESVDLASLTDRAELLEVPAMPSGTYKSVQLSLNYSTASLWVNLNGQALAATPVNQAGTAITTDTVTVTFDPNNPLVITQGKSTRLAFDIDLAASNSINTSTTPATVTVRPFLVATPVPADATLMRARGLLVTVQSGSSNYIINVRPLTDLASGLGAVTVSTDAQTYVNI
ncbi:MAG TPA: DUF4382 domain-containing protein, partial [Steroidobacteraceae bacterium]